MRAAQIISIVFHPLLLTTYLVLMLGVWMPSLLLVRQDRLPIFVGLIFGITFLLPATSLFLFRQYGLISSWKMTDRGERIFPFMIISVVYVVIAGLFLYKNQSMTFTKLLLIIAALVVTTTASTFFSKVSAHSLAWWGVVGIILPLNKVAGTTLLWPTAVLILIAGIVMSARLKLNAHTLKEIMTGAVMGFVVSFIGMNLLF